jgi:hypothetical protein
MINRRSALVLDKVFPLLSDAGIAVGEKRPADEVERILGHGLVRQLKVYAPGIIKNIDEDVTSLKAAYDRLREHLSQAYPKRKFLRIEFASTASKAISMEANSKDSGQGRQKQP